ncbi:dual CXXC motif small (seleno)protein [Desulfofustis limnaeus]|jgi:hypothetical protein|uniref:Com family DNA-binding transcriptional regulator n=1 Tax=Desulfofustis limnaeus TaxID=2740163 RepID=A0ABN6M1R9_9BACT|nr:dual CXXC motif small (seleno)protein [Desulfofustis limnaeus]BDD86827.1 hypothetical protein DPPLL_11920 [Desulfofustis limnaeus]
MKCAHCQGDLEVLRSCRRIRMRCTRCGRQFALHEVAAQLDEETELILEKYNAVIYD